MIHPNNFEASSAIEKQRTGHSWRAGSLCRLECWDLLENDDPARTPQELSPLFDSLYLVASKGVNSIGSQHRKFTLFFHCMLRAASNSEMKAIARLYIVEKRNV